MYKKYNLHFEISERKILLRFFDVIWVLFVLYVVGILFELDYFRISTQFWTWGAVLAVYLSIFSSVFELYDLQKASKFDNVLKNVVLTTSVTVLFFLLTPFLTPVLPDNRLQIIYFYLAIISALLVWRTAYITLIASPRFYKRVLIMGDSANIELCAAELEKPDPHYAIVGYIDTNELPKKEMNDGKIRQFPTENLALTLKENAITEILILDSNVNNVNSPLYHQLIALLKTGFPVKDYNQVYEEKTHRIPVQHLEKDFYKFFPFSRSNENKFYLFMHRLTDIMISILGIFLGLVLVPFILVGNVLGNRGSLFYRQERVGRNGKVFRILKFRSMKIDAESNGAQWAQKNDTRATPFGKFLRRTRMDEFPQFYNILKGEMSLIGPRPERPVFVKELSEKIAFYDTRHVVKPGLTGWAQVMGEYGNSHACSLEKLQYDLYYIKHRNFFTDLTVLTKTLSTIIFFRGQ